MSSPCYNSVVDKRRALHLVDNDIIPCAADGCAIAVIDLKKFNQNGLYTINFGHVTAGLSEWGVENADELRRRRFKLPVSLRQWRRRDSIGVGGGGGGGCGGGGRRSNFLLLLLCAI